MDTMDQRLNDFNAELAKAKEQLASGTAKAKADAADKLAALKLKVQAATKETGASANAALAKFQTDLSAFEMKVRSTADSARSSH